MEQRRAPQAGDNLLRGITLEHRAAEGDEPERFTASISSEDPYRRWFGVEILDHSKGAINLERAADGLPLLFGHDGYSADTLIGRAENVRVEGKRLKADLRFFSDDESQRVAQKVREGHREMSIGYRVDEMKREKVEEGKDDVFRVTKWTPFEASIVSVPADATVGVGRQYFQPAAQPAATAKGVQSMDQQQTAPAGANAEVRAMAPQMSDADRVKGILDLGETYAKYVGQRDIADAIRQGRSIEQFKDLILAKMEAAQANAKPMILDMSKHEIRRYSLFRAVLAAADRDWAQAGFERECSDATARLFGRSPEGFFIPMDVLLSRDFNVGTTTEAGNLVQTTVRADLWNDALRNALVMPRLGARVLTGLRDSLSIPRKATASTLGTLTEIGSASESNPTTAALSLTPKRVGAFVEVSKQAIIQGVMDVEAMIRDDLLAGAAVQIEYLAINGNGTSPQHAGIRNTTGIGTVVAGTNGVAPAWSHIVDLETTVAVANAEPDTRAGYLINPKTRGRLKQTTRGTNLEMIWAQYGNDFPLNNYRVAVTTNVPSNLTKGTSTTVCSSAIFSSDWSQEVLAFFGAPDVIVNPYSKDDTGQVKITLNQFADSGVRQPGCFAKIDDMITG
jgi:HK97 family phage major capsid protein/HK97 family phage prohead protease